MVFANCVPSGGCKGELVPLPFSASRGHLHSLAHGPFSHFQSQYQPLVFSANSMPIGIPVWGVIEGNYSVQNSSTVVQHQCENSTAVTEPWGQDLWLDRSFLHVWTLHCADLLLSALCVCSGLHWSAQLCFSETAVLRKHSLQSLVEKKSVFVEPQVSQLI